MEADIVFGQPDFGQNSAGVSANRFNTPTHFFSDGERFFIADRGNHRVLIYNSLPNESGIIPDTVLGQPNFNSNTSNNGGVGANTFSTPDTLYFDGSNLAVADLGNNRVLLWNGLPGTNFESSDVVIGQTNFTNVAAGSSASGIQSPIGPLLVEGKLIFSDYANNRVLVFNSVPTTNGAAADVVIGQANFTATSSGVGPNRLFAPTRIFFDGKRLFIPDEGNNRILVYNGIPQANDAMADFVLGQPDFYSRAASTTQAGLNNAGGVFSDGRRIIVGDSNNHRVLVWNSIPTTSGVPADMVLGQPDFNTRVSGTSRSSFNWPHLTFSTGNRLFVVDVSNHRVVGFLIGRLGGDALSPQFSQGKGVLGKVFWDSNENGMQDEGENGIAGVKVASDTGIYAITDEDGKYHYPYIETGQRVLKVDPSTVAEGSVLTTDNPRTVTVTEGILTKVSFGVTDKHLRRDGFAATSEALSAGGADSRFRGDAVLRSSNDSVAGSDSVSGRGGEPLLKVSVAQDPLDVSKTLSVTHDWKDDSTLDFKITCNYRLFVSSAEILLYDKTQNLIQTIALPHPLPYKHTLDFNQHNIDPNAIRFYQLKVYDKDGASDVTALVRRQI